jgi:hypothetical protein
VSDQIPMFTQTTNAITGRIVNHPARHTDPDSSHIAAVKLRQSGKLGAQRHMVLALLASKGFRLHGEDVPVTARQMAGRDTELYHVVARRLPELKARGLADAEPHPDGQVWRITAAGRAALGGGK